MRTALLVSQDEGLRARLARGLDGRTVFHAGTDDDALRTLRRTQVELIVKDATVGARDPVAFIGRARQLCPTGVVVCVLSTEEGAGDEQAVIEAADFVLLHPFTGRHLQGVLRQAEEKLRLLQEVAALRSSRRLLDSPPPLEEAAPAAEVPADTLTQVVKEFAKALSAGFHLPRVLDLFLDAVGEMVRPTRSAILLADQEGLHYRVEAYRGLAPHLAESVTLSADGGLPLWLAAEGRLIHLEEAQARSTDPPAREIAQELSLLQAVVAIPLISRGELAAVLTLGQRVSGVPYSRRETEILFNLATHLATAIRDIRVHNLIQYQKQFTERILAHMSSGVLTIAPDERLVIVNRRAEEILGMPAGEVLGRDLRVLPSPLGDLLFEALSRRRAVTRQDVQLAFRNLPLEVSTYPVLGDGGAPMGAVLVFEDLSTQRQLAQERRQAEQLQLLTRVVARIADEIKNPLVSIRTFMELLEERYDDAAFRHHFASVVGRDVRRLVQMFEKLATLVNEGDFKLEVVDARAVVEECLAELGAQGRAGGGPATLLTFLDESTGKAVAATFSYEGPSWLVRGDRIMLKKAVAYLAWYLLRKTPGQEAKLSLAVSRLDKEDRVRITVASRTADVRAEELQRIFDPIQVVQENLIDVGPCVSQRIVEAQGGRVTARQGRAEVAFTVELPGVTG